MDESGPWAALLYVELLIFRQISALSAAVLAMGDETEQGVSSNGLSSFYGGMLDMIISGWVVAPCP